MYEPWDALQAPRYDGPAQVTALFAANALFEMLSVLALARRRTAAAAD
jgi:hypothetical protein